jgi:tRNA U54 and U55 pseudouridine synthase Pus10
MEIRIKYQKGVPFVMIIEEPGDRFIDYENAIKECIDELAELVQSIKMEKMEEE